MKLTLARHANVDENYKNCYNGHNDISLSKTGKKEAKEMCELLDILKFDAIFCSDTHRAKETLKYSTHAKKAIYSDKLREKSWGKHEGMNFDEIIEQGEIKYENFLQWIDALDGEDYKEFMQRVKKFFFQYLPSLDKENILVITHSGVIRVFLSILHDISLEDAFSIKIQYAKPIHYDIKNGDLKNAIL